jgi:hypothetical protein
MLILAATTDTVEAVLAGAVNSQQQHVWVGYEDIGKCDGRSHFGSKDTLTNSTTDVTVCSAPDADHYRLIKSIHVLNDDDATSTITLKIANGTTEPVLFRATLATKEMITWTPEGGWVCLTALGKVKITAHA